MSHTCPRRQEIGADTTRDRDSYGHRDGIRCCSYCGSMHPDDFMNAIRDGKVLGPTDKSYKVYVHERPMNADESAAREFYGDVKLAAGRMLGKFYFQHLSDAQRHGFISLHNEQKIRIGFPGRFYRLPFFCKPAAEVSTDEAHTQQV